MPQKLSPQSCFRRLRKCLRSLTQHAVELRLIPEFGGSPSESVAEWLEKVQLVCDLRCIDKPETLVPLWLTGGAFAVYQQLSASDKCDFSKLKEALLVAFGADSFAAYEQLTTRRLRSTRRDGGRYVFIAELRKTSSAFCGTALEAAGLAKLFFVAYFLVVREMRRLRGNDKSVEGSEERK